MNTGAIMTVALFAGFAACMWAVAWLASRGMTGWGWILFVSILFFGNIDIKHTDIAKCPNCHTTFKVDSAERSAGEER